MYMEVTSDVVYRVNLSKLASLVSELLLGLLLLLLATVFLVHQEVGTNGSQANDGSTGSNIGGFLLVLQGLNALLVSLVDAGDSLPVGTIVGNLTASILTGLKRTNGQADLTLGFSVGGVDIKLARKGVVGGLHDLVQGDGGKGNGGINGGLIVENFDVELVVLGLEVLQGQGLVPDGVLSSVLVDKGLLERLVVLEVEGDASVGIVLSETLNIIQVVGRVNSDFEGSVVVAVEHVGVIGWWWWVGLGCCEGGKET